MNVRYKIDSTPIQFIDHEAKCWITTKGIADGLNVPKDSIKKIYKRNKNG
ncbi:hypothetical protein WKT22_00234 [Candidatus Lokiarchaeum ossiferum]